MTPAGWLVVLIIGCYLAGRWSFAYELKATAERFPESHRFPEPRSHVRLVEPPPLYDQDSPEVGGAWVGES